MKQYTDIVKRILIDRCSGVPEFNMKSCCKQHDDDYETKGKFSSDWSFLKCGLNKAGSYGWKQPHKVLATSLVSIGYYIGVTILGWRAYNNAQTRGL